MTRITFNDYASGLAKQSLCIDNCDKLYLCYGEGQVLFSSKAKYGVWSTPQEVSFGDGKRYSYAMAVNPVTGIVHAVLIRYFYAPLPNFGELFYGSNAGGTWEFTRIDSSAYGGYGGRPPAIAIDSVGNAHLIWTATHYDTSLSHHVSRIVYSVNIDGDWGTQVVYSSAGEYNGVTPWIEVEENGIAHIMWRLGSVYHLKNDTLSGTVWTADMLSEFPIAYPWFSDFKVDSDGNLHMLIEGIDYWGGPRYLYYYFRPVGSEQWEDPELVSDKACISRIAFGPQGRVHLVWTESAGNFCGLSLYYSVRNEGGWSSWEIVGENFDYEYTIELLWPCFVVDSDLYGHAVFAACEGLPVLSDSVEIFHYAALDPYDVGHVVFLINYLYRQGPDPNCRSDYDLNCDGELTLSDVIVLINYLFRGGALFCH